jgi:hypothetical protein
MYWLRGKTLHTLGAGKPFIVKSVDENSMVVIPRSSGRERTLRRSEIESAFNELWVSRELTLKSIREQHSELNPSYIVSLLAQLPAVDFVCRPIKLFWKE